MGHNLTFGQTNKKNYMRYRTALKKNTI